MFLESLIESGRTREPRRGWATLASFALQAVAIGALVLVPLLYTGALPPLHIAEPMPPPPAAPRPQTMEPEHVDLVPVPSELTADGRIHEPRAIPHDVFVPDKPEVAPAVGNGNTPCTYCVPGGIGTPEGVANAVLTQLLKPADVPAVHADLRPRPLPVSTGVIEGLLLHRIDPKYPPLAVTTRVQGTVILQAIIGRGGRVDQLQVVQGHPLLAKAALDAVRQWRYRPYMLNGAPVEVEAQIYVIFKLSE